MKSIITNKSINKNNKSLATLLNIMMLATFLLLPTHNVLAEQKLPTLQKQIQQTKSKRKAQAQQQAKLEKQIAESEKQIAAASLQLQKTETTIANESKGLTALKKEIKTLQQNKAKQQKLLEQQLISAYMTGQNDLIKLLLNQESLSKIIRAKSYYHYLNQARLESITQLQNTEKEIEDNSAKQKSTLLSLEKMRDQQVQSNKQLSSERSKRNKALRELKQDINYQNARLSELNDAEKKLKKALKKQQKIRQQQALAAARAKAKAEAEARAKAREKKLAKSSSEHRSYSKIASMRGQLRWPINGRVLASFGSKRSAQVKWKGLSIAANEGEKVRAVAMGRVLFAGYFKGYGMVIALDHSDDYITLYGYNQTLLHKTGDIVLEGDAIALAGQSGGQDKNSLYFELSHKGKAQDPIKWLKRR